MSKSHPEGRKREKAQPAPAQISWRLWLAPLLLFAATFLIYGRTGHFDFVDYDDGDVVLNNPHLQDGVTLASLRWALTAGYAANWFPVTWISHMLDVQLFGLDAGWHHLTNVLVHALSAMLLFAVMKRMTGCFWESAFVAFVFALHPLHVESVAWVSERKDVLSAFFFLLTLWAYLNYVGRRTVGRYFLVVGAFGLGLMSKQMIVTLPFVLLLLDVWPLRRIGLGMKALLLEKTPLFLMSIAASVTTIMVQRQGEAVRAIADISFLLRVQNALIAYVTYLVKFVWPTGLGPFYPFPRNVSTWEAAAAGAALAGISVLAIHQFRTRPYLTVGWFWYVGTLLPVIGLVQVGDQARADRYTYLPMVGISILLAWGGADILAHTPRFRTAFASLTIILCSAWSLQTWIQVQYWKDSATLWRHALDVTPDNYLAHVSMGIVFAQRKEMGKALENLYSGVREQPGYTSGHYNLAQALEASGRREEALAEYQHAVRLRPKDAQMHYGLGNCLLIQGKMSEAAAELSQAVRLNPDLANAHFGLGTLLAIQQRPIEASREFAAAIRLRPEDVEAHFNLGNAMLASGKFSEAAQEFSTAIRLKPDFADAHASLGGLLASVGRLDEAIAQLSEAVRLNPELGQARESLVRAQLQRQQQP